MIFGRMAPPLPLFFQGEFLFFASPITGSAIPDTTGLIFLVSVSLFDVVRLCQGHRGALFFQFRYTEPHNGCRILQMARINCLRAVRRCLRKRLEQQRQSQSTGVHGGRCGGRDRRDRRDHSGRPQSVPAGEERKRVLRSL